MKKIGFFLEESVDLHEEAGKENEQTLANLGPDEEATSKDEVDIYLCSFAFLFGHVRIADLLFSQCAERKRRNTFSLLTFDDRYRCQPRAQSFIN